MTSCHSPLLAEHEFLNFGSNMGLINFSLLNLYLCLKKPPHLLRCKLHIRPTHCNYAIQVYCIWKYTEIFFVFLFIFIVILLQLSRFSYFAEPTQFQPPGSHSQSPHYCPCPWVIHTSSLTSPFSFFPTLSPLPLHSGSWQSVPCFYISGSVLLVSLFCSLNSSYK